MRRLLTAIGGAALAAAAAGCAAWGSLSSPDPRTAALLEAWSLAQPSVVLWNVPDAGGPEQRELDRSLCRAAESGIQHTDARGLLGEDAEATPVSKAIPVPSDPGERSALFKRAAAQCAVDLESVTAAGCMHVHGHRWDPDTASGPTPESPRPGLLRSTGTGPPGGYGLAVYRIATESCMLSAVADAFDRLGADPPRRVVPARLYEAYDAVCLARGSVSEALLTSSESLPGIGLADRSDAFLSAFSDASVACRHLSLDSISLPSQPQ